MAQPRYVVVTPVRNEAANVPKTIESMVGQTLRPLQWVIVDDGSTDGTAAVLAGASGTHLWITSVSRPDRGFRKSGGGVVEAFYDGYAALRHDEWDFLVKLDGDLSFGPDYFERCLQEFSSDARLGIGGGVIRVLEGSQLRVDGADAPPFHVRGATKIYRRECWRQIMPLVVAPGWDTIDEVRANMLGWTTRTFPNVALCQHRATGAVDGEWRTWFKNGVGCYVAGYHPFFMIGRCVKRGRAKPLVGSAMWLGFCSGYVKRVPRAHDSAEVRYLRRQQLLRILGRPSIYGRSWRVVHADLRARRSPE